MAYSSTIEKNTVNGRKENQDSKDPEWMHNARMEEYRKVLYSGLDVMDSDVADEVITAEPRVEEDRTPSYFASAPAPAPVQAPAAPEFSAAQRMAAYHAYPAPATRRNLFEGITLKNGELVSDVPAQDTATAPQAAAPAPAPATEASEEDARPTPRTMAALNASVRTETAASQGFFSSLSTKTKVVLLTVVTAIVLAIVLICINTAIINSINADVAQKQQAVERLAQEAQSLQESIDEITDPESIRAWAESMGMTHG